MRIHLDELRSARFRAASKPLVKSLHNARLGNHPTAFLSHSHKDKEFVEGLQVLLYEYGWHVYIDWLDHSLPDQPSRETALKIKNKIDELGWFFFLATPNSVTSRWCPWEIGYADKSKPHRRILIIPTEDRSGAWYGNEYLQLYNQLNLDKGQVVIRGPGIPFGVDPNRL